MMSYARNYGSLSALITLSGYGEIIIFTYNKQSNISYGEAKATSIQSLTWTHGGMYVMCIVYGAGTCRECAHWTY